MSIDVNTPASERLRRYLAENDVECAGCGRNLRGVAIVACPSCARIIESSHTHLPAGAVAARCHRCGYMLHGLATKACPECGARDITIGDIHDRMARGQRGRVPRFLKLCGGCGSVVILWNLLTLPVLGLPRDATHLQLTLFSFASSMAPGALVVIIYQWPGLLRASRPRAELARRIGAGALGVLLVVIAVLLARR